MRQIRRQEERRERRAMASEDRYISLLAELRSEKGEVLLRGVGTLRYLSILSESCAFQAPICAVAACWFDNPHQKVALPGAGFLGAPPISLKRGAANGEDRRGHFHVTFTRFHAWIPSCGSPLYTCIRPWRTDQPGL